MSSISRQDATDRIAEVLRSVRKKGVRLWSKHGDLHYKAPKGALTREELETLRSSRGQIVALLERTAGAEIDEPTLESSRRPDRAPLTFSQLAHWNLYQLSERRAIRQIASATHVRGQLSLEALEKSVEEIVQRHDALRTRIVVHDGVPMQEIASGNCELRVDDLTTTPESLREPEVIRIIEQHILEPIDVAAGPLFGVRLLRFRDDEHVLIAAMEHMISDMFSLNILLRDLFEAYRQIMNRTAVSLPEMPMQFTDYAVWQKNAQTSWIEKHSAYWNERLMGCQRVRFPDDNSLQIATGLGWGTVPVKIERDLKKELREWCRLRRTTLAMSTFVAYVALILRWCEVSEAVIRYVTDGRISAKIENTIGYFASVLYLRIEVSENDSFVDLMKQVTEEYCRAYEHADSSYMAAQVPRPDFARNSAFNWVPEGRKVNLPSSDGSGDAITCSPIRFSHPMLRKLELDIEPFVLLFDTDDEIVGDVHFPLYRFSVDTMESFARNFTVFIRALLRQPEGRVKDVVLLRSGLEAGWAVPKELEHMR